MTLDELRAARDELAHTVSLAQSELDELNQEIDDIVKKSIGTFIERNHHEEND